MCCILAANVRNNLDGLFQWIYREHTKSDDATKSNYDFRKGVKFITESLFPLVNSQKSVNNQLTN